MRDNFVEAIKQQHDDTWMEKDGLVKKYTEEDHIKKFWSGRRESNPRIELGKLSFYH